MDKYRFVLAVVAGFIAPHCFGCTVPVFRYALDNWQGKSDPEQQENAVFTQIAKGILAGNSAVWIQIDSGSKDLDDSSYELLQTRLQFFESVAELPVIDPNDPSSRIGPGPELALKFSTIRIKRDDPAVAMIAGEKLDSLPKNEPWIAPVFGRGRVLGIWEASRMDEEGIDEACFYLTGACSCQVKVQNPGWDLVMNVDWDEQLLAVAEGPVEPEDSVAEEKEDVVEEAKFTPIFRPPTSDINFLEIIAGIGLVVGIFLLIKQRRSKAE